MLEDFMTWLMIKGSTQHSLWFAYVTFHDLIQWGIMGIIGLTAYGQRKHKKELQSLVNELKKELAHVHDEIHVHLGEPYGKENEHRRVYRLEESLHGKTGPS
jgi:hypothetical protein